MATISSPTSNEQFSEVSKGFLGSKSIFLPYIIAIIAQAPLLLWYFSKLWRQPHYQFFPFALLMVGVYAYLRWPRNISQPFIERRSSKILFWVGVVFGIAGALFAHDWFCAASLVALLTSLFAMTRDGEEHGKTLFVLGLPLLSILMLPNNYDRSLITFLQHCSADVSSSYLDLLNFKHYSPGTTLNFPARNYDVERACSGVQSFFLLMFCATWMIVSLRRHWFRGILLLLAAGFWAVFMNSIRILAIPIADIMFGIDIGSGLAHDILGYTAMLIAIGLILSTDQLLEFLFGRNQTVEDERQANWFQRKVLRKSSTPRPEETLDKRTPVGSWFRTSTMIGAVVLCGFGILQFIDFARSMGQSNLQIRVFSSNVIIDLEDEAMPTEIKSQGEEVTFHWTKLKYDRKDRTRGSDFGQRSDSWFYRSRNSASRLACQASLDQTFPGWHELTACYLSKGWTIKPGARVKKEATLTTEDGDELKWSYIEVEMVQPITSQQALLLFSFTDAAGVPFDAPIEWGKLRYYYEAAKNRLLHSVRAKLFRGEAYQMQVFAVGPTEFSSLQKEEIRSQYLQIRSEMRNAVLKYGDEDFSGASSEDQESSSENSEN